jgi:regulator of replication initiation timing
MSKKGLNDDLQRLLTKRQEIENLQTTLVGIIQNSTSRKIDLDDLKRELASTVRQNRFEQRGSPIRREADQLMRKVGGKSRSKSKGAVDNSVSFSSAMTLNNKAHGPPPGKLQVYEDTNSAVPAWYKTLKKNL